MVNQEETQEEAWKYFLGRKFKGMEDLIYRGPFGREIKDPYLKSAALESLNKAGRDQVMRTPTLN